MLREKMLNKLRELLHDVPHEKYEDENYYYLTEAEINYLVKLLEVKVNEEKS